VASEHRLRAWRSAGPFDGAEIDKIIWEFEAQKALAIERRRRADWRKGELAAERFRAECDHADAVALPRSAADRLR
jgi:hypothetical protein